MIRGGSALEQALDFVRRNPARTMLAAAGVGWLIYRSRARRRAAAAHAAMIEEESIPILNTGHAFIYDPDASPRHPMQDQLHSRREMSTRA